MFLSHDQLNLKHLTVAAWVMAYGKSCGLWYYYRRKVNVF